MCMGICACLQSTAFVHVKYSQCHVHVHGECKRGNLHIIIITTVFVYESIII